MATIFKRSRLWIVEFSYRGRPRSWIKALPEAQDGHAVLAAQLRDLYGDRAQIAEIRLATAEEETQYVQGTEPRNVFCPAAGPGR